MSNLLSYKNYNGTMEYSREDGCLFGNDAVEKAIENMVG